MKSRFLVYFAFIIGAVFTLPVMADPIAGYDQTAPMSSAATTQSPRGTATSPRTGRAVPATAAAKTGTAQAAPTSRSVGARGVQAHTPTGTAAPRNVAVRPGSVARTTDNRAVRARTGETPNSARVGVVGPAIRASTGTSISSLANRLYTGTFSNIIDPTTGLISADAYSNCLESYYACMDEICTARNPGQRRCACAGRVRTFNDVEAQLQKAREDLLKVSGELTLIIASKGKEINAAFSLTEAEKTLNCVSWRDAKINNTTGKWCFDHMVPGTTSSGTGAKVVYACPSAFPEPDYCGKEISAGGIGLGMNWSDILNGADSDILASLKTYASTIDQVNVITTNNDGNLFFSFMNVNDIVNQITGGTSIFNTNETSADFLARLWGYNLFQYAHNNVCNRVLDSCFNGIYEACGTPKSGQKCSNGQSQCPFNYNSIINVANDGNDLNFVNPGDTYTNNASAACYGYNNVSGDPYGNLRRPVADSRRSVVQKYALDANADCDLYGEELKRQATNMSYQRIAATQLLQNKRLEFKMEESLKIETDYLNAGSNFNECISEIYDCYNTQMSANTNPAWSASRIKTYCAQSVNVPSCYRPMICNPSSSQLRAMVDILDSQSCNNTQDIAINNCRNVVTLNEILSGVVGVNDSAMNNFSVIFGPGQSSTKLREYCIRQAIGTESSSIRKFGVVGGWGPGSGNESGAITSECQAPGAVTAMKTWDGSGWGPCIATSCMTGYSLSGNNCVARTYTINYNLNGGTNVGNPITYTVSQLPITLVNPMRANSVFAGWYQNGVPSTGVIPVGTTGVVQFYAQWTCDAGFTVNSSGDGCE